MTFQALATRDVTLGQTRVTELQRTFHGRPAMPIITAASLLANTAARDMPSGQTKIGGTATNAPQVAAG